ncbi:MAG: sigma-54-dependent Fis family transcriptional regulator, partial [Planctomycetota bacterium]|nr:sigma-54-dependent Fis family transcriptional regulator [Planctomycetota bacterium]
EMRRLMVLADDEVTLEHLSASILDHAGAGPVAPDGLERAPEILGDLREAVGRFEQRAIESALSRAGGNKSRAAKDLGISRFALQRKLDKYKLGKGATGIDAG